TAQDAHFESAQSAEVGATPVASALILTGTLAVVPADILTGTDVGATATVTNAGASTATAVSGVVAVASTSGSQTFTLNLLAGETKPLALVLATSGLPAGVYTVVLSAGPTSQVLAMAPLRIHGPLQAPAIDSPANGARVPTARPTLAVSDVAHVEAFAV